MTIFEIVESKREVECHGKPHHKIPAGEPRLRIVHGGGTYTVNKSLCLKCLKKLIEEKTDLLLIGRNFGQDDPWCDDPH